MKSPVEKHWITEEGYVACVILHKSCGHRCGYVLIPETHPAYGYPYYVYSDDDRIELLNKDIVEKVNDIYVHGGLTYSETGDNKFIEDSNNKWIFGFDAGHCDDKPDFEALLSLCESRMETERVKTIQAINEMYPTGGVIRDHDYMVHQCERLSVQLRDIEEEFSNES